MENKKERFLKGEMILASFTENYSLTKPEEADYYDIGDFNANMDAIDGAMAETAAEVAGIGEKIGTPETEGDTVFSLLAGKSGGLIKSIQHIIHEVEDRTSQCSIPIQPIDPAKTMVIFERLADDFGTGCNMVTYRLEAEALQLTYQGDSSFLRIYGFWIVEFC